MILSLTTNQISAFKTSFEVLDSLITEVNLEISLQGIVIREVNKSSKLLVSLNLPAENFDTYEYTYGFENYNLGLDVSSITSKLKTPLKYDSLTLVVNSKKVTLLLENFQRKEKKHLVLKTTTSCPCTTPSITPVEYAVSICISSDLLTKYTKELNRSSETFTITVAGDDEFVLELSNSETSFHLYESKFMSVFYDINYDERVEVSSTLIATYFCILSKLGNLSEFVNIYLSPDTFTSVKYTLGSLGTFTVVLL